ncbi:MAG: riboflavin biosynthesis protein RibF [Marinilabiliales bacterium]|nr:MAG: riboflavin biosynthesis protein RibF [Marinilabiliales bacterium]
MKIYNCIKDFEPVKNTVVTIGTFDGVHLGHRAIFNKMMHEAVKIDGETVVITFYPHPRIVLGLDSSKLKFINTQEKKINRLEEAGIDHLIIVSFTKQFAGISSYDFIKDFVVEKINPSKLIIGFDHHFGKNRRGSFDQLSELGREVGFSVEQVEEQKINDMPISSTKIRTLLEAGKVSAANMLLGYEYSITGKVVPGNAIGRGIGFPTANIEIADEFKLITANGVYACRVYWMGKSYKGMSNIGYRPTINKGELTIEVNIFNFDERIYDQQITISFVERMRDEKKFKDKEALIEQLKVDKVNALKLLE